MTYQTIVNAAPFHLQLGTQDGSTRPLLRDPEAIPTHLPKVYIYAKKGPTTPQLVSGGSRSFMYGEESFDPRKKWANHATILSNTFESEGNAQMIERVIPADAGPEANLLLSLDVLDTTIDDYVRNSDGSIKLNATTGEPVVNGSSKIPGYLVKWVVTSIDDPADLATDFGAATIKPGTQTTGGATPTTSQLYPILQLKMSYIGSDGNNTGIRIWAPNTSSSGAFDKRLMSQLKLYPFRISVIRRQSASQTPRIEDTIFGEQSVLTTFKPGQIDPNTDSQLSIGDVFLQAFQNLTDPKYPAVFGEFGEMKVYDNNVETLLEMFYDREKTFIDTPPAGSNIVHDFSSTNGVIPGEEWLFNMLTGMSSQSYPYHTFRVISAANAVRLGDSTNIYASGGDDGTMSNSAFAALVADRVTQYQNPNSQLMNQAINVESIIYDSGFPLQTKYALCSFISQRPDTFVALGTHEVGGPKLTASQDNSTAIALRTRLQMYPESDYFGTPVMRGLVMGRSGLLRSAQFKERMSVLMEVAKKAAAYMGASNGIWKSGKNFDGYPGHIVNSMYDLSVTYTSIGVRNRDWDAGLNWVQDFDRRSQFIPALKTVYSDDTSVLNSFITAMAIVEVNKVCDRVWREFSGVSGLTDLQLTDRVNRSIEAKLAGRFDDRFKFDIATYFTDVDKARGYSWTTRVDIYANNMKTVMTSFVRAKRMSDYVAQP